MRRRMSRRGNVAHTAGDFAALLHEPGSVGDRRQVLPSCSNRALLEWGRAAANCQPRFRTGCRSSSPTRYRRIRTEPSDPAIAVEQATVLMGPALILTALVLACGLAGARLLQPPDASSVRLVRGVRHARGARRRSSDPEARRHLPASAAAVRCRSEAAPID